MAVSNASVGCWRCGVLPWHADVANAVNLQLNPKRWDVLPNTAAGVSLGYRVSRTGISPSRKLRRSLARRLRLAARRGYEPLVRSIQAYRGLLLF